MLYLCLFNGHEYNFLKIKPYLGSGSFLVKTKIIFSDREYIHEYEEKFSHSYLARKYLKINFKITILY